MLEKDVSNLTFCPFPRKLFSLRPKFIDAALADSCSKDGEEKVKVLVGYMIKMREYLTITLHENGLKAALLSKTVELINESNEQEGEKPANKKKELDFPFQKEQEENTSAKDQKT